MAKQELSRKESVILYQSQMQMLEELPPDEFKKIVLSLFDYAVDGVIPDFTGCADSLALIMSFKVIASQIDRDSAAYQKSCERQSERARKRWEYKNQQNATVCHGMPQNAANADTDTETDTDTVTDTDKEKDNKVSGKKRSRFKQPTLEEVSAYCRERRYSVDPERFIDYYMSQGWKKKNGLPVSDWKACVRTWEKKDKQQSKPTQDDGLLDGIL